MSLDGYDVIRELGRGGMAVVHLARQRDLQRLVALKELSGFNARDPAFAERFLRESRMASSLNHPNIVTVYEYFEDGGVPYIAMELVEGGSLRPLIGEMSLPQVGRVLEDLLAAIGQAGRAGIAHRDLKPENALITKEGRLKVADFGIAKAAASGQQGLTSEGMTVGTPEYMSPEQALAKGVGPSSDLYAIGCMTYEMLTGRLPFENKSQAALLMSHVQDPVPDVRGVDPLIPDSVAAWVQRMTEKDPDDRFEDAAAAWEAFEEAVLEHIGPLWRRSATLEPSSEIDLSSIPPQTDTPMRPASSPEQRAAPAGSQTGYQTYHAPAALHEVLGTDSDDAIPAAATPPPRPSAAPAPRRVTAASLPSVATRPTTSEPVGETADEPEEASLPVGAIVGGAVVVAIIAFVIGMTSGGSPEPASASADGIVLKAPDGWKAADAGLIPAVGSAGAALAPPGAGAGEGAAAARMPTAKAVALVQGASDAERVQLAAGEAVRVTNGDATLYVLPTDAGAVVVGCSASPAVSESCASIAGSVELTRGRALPPGPTDDGARALSGALTRLSDGIRNPTEDLRRAKSPSAQATAAGDLARVYRAAATEIGKAPLGALASRARDQMASALKSVGDGWDGYADGADSGNAGGVAGARSAIARARTRVGRARSALAAAGYIQGGG